MTTNMSKKATIFVILLQTSAIFAGNDNETAQKQIDDDFANSSATFSRNFSATISVSDANLTGKSSQIVEGRNGTFSDEISETSENIAKITGTTTERAKKFADFRPSPQVESYFEYNKYPVKPAYPEAKTVPGYAKANADVTNRFSIDKSRNFNLVESEFDGNSPKETPWISRVRFPANDNNFDANKIIQKNPADYRNNPYYSTEKGYNNEPKNRFSAGFSSSGPSEEFNFNKLVEVPNKNYYYYPSAPETPSYNLMEKPNNNNNNNNYGLNSKTASNPWKKILKLLVTFIPIGLLISALTPTVITVTSANDTINSDNNNMQTRYRSSDSPKKELHAKILNSLDYFDKLNENGCEYRVFCELLSTARHMPDSESHVRRLLDNLANHDIDYKSRSEELKRVFEAVRNDNCDSMECDLINDKNVNTS